MAEKSPQGQSADALEDDAPFPPPLVTRTFAWALSLALLPLIVYWWGLTENSEPHKPWVAWLFLAGLLISWLSDIWTGQGHLDHGTAAFVLAAGLVAASLLLTFA